MGGSDKYNLTTTTVKSLLTIDNLHLSIIIGPFFSHKKTLMKIISSNPNISLHISPSKIWQIFSTADVAVCTGGNTLFELACMGIPTLSIPSVEHEIKYTEKFNSQNFSLDLELREKNLDLIKSSILQLIYDVKLQKKMSIHGQKIIDVCKRTNIKTSSKFKIFRILNNIIVFCKFSIFNDRFNPFIHSNVIFLIF